MSARVVERSVPASRPSWRGDVLYTPTIPMMVDYSQSEPSVMWDADVIRAVQVADAAGSAHAALLDHLPDEAPA